MSGEKLFNGVEHQHPYRGRQIALGTKHKKEQVIRPQFLMQLGAGLVVPDGMDTDTLGTFTGEVERQGTAYEAALKKAEWAMSLTGLKLAISSEGSFGPHPQIGFIPADSEWMVFIDRERDITVVENSVTTDTNFGHIVVKDIKNAKRFLQDALFPSHGMIVRPHISASKSEYLFKGITSLPKLEEAVDICRKQSEDGKAQIETDMRAHMNPKRQFAIQLLAQKLAKRLRTSCASCGAPGWGLLDVVLGLPCEICARPTSLAMQEKMGCVKCGATELCDRGDGLRVAEARYCNGCNP